MGNGNIKVSRVDELDFERLSNIAKGFGWQMKKTEIKLSTLEVVMEKERVEPDTDITLQPT